MALDRLIPTAVSQITRPCRKNALAAPSWLAAFSQCVAIKQRNQAAWLAAQYSLDGGLSLRSRASIMFAPTQVIMARKPARSTRKRRKAPKARPSLSAQKHKFTRGLYGWITHTDLATRDPAATKAWCAEVFGWTFKPAFPVPGGEIHLFAYSAQGGGAVRPVNPPELPGSIPYVHVADAAAAFARAVKAGAEEMMSPTRVMEGVTAAIVRAPGGVPIGLSGP